MEGTASSATGKGKQRPASDALDFSVAFPFSDVKLVSASGDVLYGSRYTLAVRSPVCKQMLLSGMKEGKSMAMSEMLTIPFPGMRTEALQVLLEFCTDGFFSEKRLREAPVDVIHAARYFQLTDDMKELIDSVVAEKLRLAETLSLALECLPTDSESYFFQGLMKKIFSRPVAMDDLPYDKLSAEALMFLLSKTRNCSEPWVSSIPFCSSECTIFFYVLRWSAHQISEFAPKQLEAVIKEEPGAERIDLERIDVETCAPETLEVLETLESAGRIAQPFLPFIDFRLIKPEDLAREIAPLKIVPPEMLVEGFCHHAKAPALRSPSLYRGPCVLQWSPYPCSPGISIDVEPCAEGRALFCESEISGLARTCSGLDGRGEHSWIVTISNPSDPALIGIGFCSELEEGDYTEWLGSSSKGWVLDGSARFWHDDKAVVSTKHGRWIQFGFGVTEVQVSVNFDRRTCSFTITDNGKKEGTLTFGSGNSWPRGITWHNIPKVIYPAVSFNQAFGHVSIRPAPL